MPRKGIEARRAANYDHRVATHPIRLFGDPVLKNPAAAPVADIDGASSSSSTRCTTTMYDAHGAGLAATQVGVGSASSSTTSTTTTGPHVLVNPEIVETAGEWIYEEGCLSLPGLAFEIVRPKFVTVQATRPRRQRGDRDRGRRAARAGVPARDRPPRRRAHARPARARRSARKRCGSCASRACARRRAVGYTLCSAEPVG